MESRVGRSPSGRLVRVGQGKTAYWAFVPHPLPPNLAYTTDLIRTLSQADRTLGELAGLGRTLPNPHLLISPLMHREAVLSSRIEGTEADLSQLYAYAAGARPKAGSDVHEVYNYVRALEYGLERVSSLPISLRLLRELHERLLDGVRGEHAFPGAFRHTQNWIGPPGCTLNEATYVPPPPSELMDALSALERYLHADDVHPPLVRLAFIHYQFEAIHPFVDGNGRIGRLLLSLLMVSWRLLPLPLLYLSAYFERHRQAYYDHLLQVSVQGAWEAWTRFFLLGVVSQATDTVQRIKQLQDLQREWRERLTDTRASALTIRLAEHLFVAPMLTVSQAAEVLGISYQGARKVVQKLLRARIIEPTLPRSKRNRSYQATRILALVSQEFHN